MFCEAFAMWRQDHVVVTCWHFKNCKTAACKRSPMGLLPFEVARTAEHCDVTSIGCRHVVATCPATKPVVPSGPVLVRNGLPQIQLQDVPSLPDRLSYRSKVFKKSKEMMINP